MASPRTPPAADAPERSRYLLVPRGWLIVLAGLALMPWIAFGVMLFSSGRAPVLAVPAPAETESLDPGPWGRLEQTPILISPPIELIADDWGREEGSGKYWFFPQTSASTAQTFLSSAGLTSAQVADLMRSAQPEPRIGGLVMLPSAELLRAMTRETRARLYSQLSGSSLNSNVAHAFRFAGKTPDDWLGGPLLQPETRALVNPLVYTLGNHLYLADIDLIFSLVTDPAERRRLGKAVLRQSTVRVRLEIRSPSEVPALVDYWGRGGRRLDIRPLIESVAGGPDASIDIVHLLPALAREHLYRYPRRTALDFDRPALANCLWTALNFFEAEPDNRLLDVNAAITRLKENYYLVQNSPEFGDVIVMVDEQGNIFHAVNFIADDLVFTKNGVSPLAPWVILPLDEVLDYYRTRSEKPKLIIHRRKDF